MTGNSTSQAAGRIEAVVDRLRDESLPSRRSFLRRSAAAGAGALAVAVSSSNAALAHDGADDEFDDVEVLNFALTLEHLEYAFYRDALERFDASDFRQANALRGFGNRVVSDVRSNLEDVRDHEETHVDTLTSVITDLGGSPVKESRYRFGYENVSEFLGVAAVLENTGVSAYDGAISLIDAEGLLTASATIATVEARHASYLNLLNGDSPFPDAFDDPRSPDKVIEAVFPLHRRAPTPTDPMAAPDVPLLNYALTLEHLENAFYREGLDEFTDQELMSAEALSEFDDRVRMAVPGYLRTVGAHEAAHVDAIAETVAALGGTPVEEGEYAFGYETPSEFFAVAQALENTGVAAYAGAAPQVVDNEVLASAAGIHSVEARHASFLNRINSDNPYPATVDDAMSIDEVLDVAGGFITSEVDPSRYDIGDDRPTHDRKAEDDTDDLAVLNYALTLEHLENAFYREGLETFSDDELMDADVLSEFGEEVRMAVPDHLRTAGAHEAAHVNAITGTVEALGGTPVEEATYDFGYETPSEFLAVAKALENTGVAAYKGAAPTVSDDDVFAAALGIHSVEARHAALLNELNGEVPFPDGVDEPRSMAEVSEIAGQFIVEE